MTIEYALLILAAYLLGSVPMAYLAAKWSRGIDIRQYGSGNIGASNLLKLTSKWVALPVIIFDFGKGALMVWAAQLIGLGVAQQVTVGLAVIIGHNWPVFLRFNGGRGALTLAGVAIILAPKLGVMLLIIAFLFTPFRQLALGTILVITALPIFSYFLDQPLGIEGRLPITIGFFFLFLITVLRRLTSPPTSLTASVPLRQLLVNRLLFDRDIRDREAWIHRAPVEVKPAERPPEQHESEGRLK